MEFVQAQQAQLLRDMAGNNEQRIFFSLQIAQPMVDVLHEAMEMHPAFALDRYRIEEGIHQEAFAPTHAAPQIEAAHRPLAQKYAQQQLLHQFGFVQFIAQPPKMSECCELRGIQRETVGVGCLPGLVGESPGIARLYRLTHQRLIVRLSTARAASCRASARVGWACTIRAMSSEAAPNSMRTTASDISSDAYGPIICTPRMRSVFASASIFTNPAVSPIARAPPFTMNGNCPARYSMPFAFNSCSVLPTHAISGAVYITQVTVSRSMWPYWP